MKNKVFLKFLLSVLLILIGFSSSAQEATYFVSKHKSEHAPETWEAKWISLHGATYEDKNHVMLARKSFDLASALNTKRVV